MKISFLYARLLFLLIQVQTTSSAIYILTFGKGENCAGFNICNISEGLSNEKDENQARVSIRLRDGRVEFEFKKQSISDKAFLKYFSTGFFILDNDYQIPTSILHDLSTKNKILKTGKYKVNASIDSYVVTF